MRKTDKKIDNNVRKALTLACDTALENVNGFRWLTHVVSYDRFPGSLVIFCVFDKNDALENAQKEGLDNYCLKLIQGHLLKVGVRFKNAHKQVQFDTEENCDRENDGNWSERIAQRKHRFIS